MNWKKIKTEIKEWLKYTRSPENIIADIQLEIAKREETERIEAEKRQIWLDREINLLHGIPDASPAPRAENTPICLKCEFLSAKLESGQVVQAGKWKYLCSSKRAPITDFFTGEKDPKQINNKGTCRYYSEYKPCNEKLIPIWRKEY